MVKELTRKGYTEIVTDYQNGNGDAFNEMLEYLGTSLKQLTSKQYNRVKSYGYMYGDVEAIGLEILWVSMETFDGSKGADFLAYFKQRFQWKVNDDLIDRKGSLGDKAVYTTISFEQQSPEDPEMTIEDTLELAEEDNSMLNVDYNSTYCKLLELYSNSANDKPVHIQNAIEKDVEIIGIVMEAVENNIVSKHDLNEYLYEQLPDVNRGSLRRNKHNAFKRFGKFLEENL